MSYKNALDSQFFSLPYDRDDRELLIDREWDSTENDVHSCDISKNYSRSQGDLKNSFQDTKNGRRSSRTDGNYMNHSKSWTSQNSNSISGQVQRPATNNLIDFGNNDNFASCNSLASSRREFADFNNANTNPCDNLINDNFIGHCNDQTDDNPAVDLRNRRNAGQITNGCHQANMDCRDRRCITTNNHSSDRCSSSPPDTYDSFDDIRDRSVCGSNGYGSVPGDEMQTPTDTSVTYCIHGKPGAGCCATLLNQPTAPAINISIDEHCHIKERDTGVNKKARRQIIVVSTLCLFFMIAEAVGGYLSGSLAIATDAAHLLTDFAGFMISLFALYVAGKKPSRIMPFGWHRAEVIGAMVSVLTIWLVTGILVYLAVQRIIEKNFEIDATVMLITSAIGVVVNIIMALTLHQNSHVHTACAHNCAPQSATAAQSEHRPNDKQNINVRAAFIHIIGDLLQSVGVFIAATIIYYKPEYVIVDPICTFMFSILVLATTVNIMKDALLVLMEGIPRDVDYNDVLSTLLAIDGVIRVHNLRIWALSLDKTALSAHLAIAPSADCTEILKAASKEIHKKYNFFEMTLQIEYFHQNMETCAQCQVP